jgi:hypothetical protein
MVHVRELMENCSLSLVLEQELGIFVRQPMKAVDAY